MYKEVDCQQKSYVDTRCHKTVLQRFLTETMKIPVNVFLCNKCAY